MIITYTIVYVVDSSSKAAHYKVRESDLRFAGRSISVADSGKHIYAQVDLRCAGVNSGLRQIDLR